MNFLYCLEQYGMPLMGKAASKLDAHRINIECFLKYSKTNSENEKLQEYYDVLKECKFSQHCCTLLKKKPSEEMQKELDVDVIIKGLMAEESHTRMVNVATRGCIFASHRDHIQDGPFYHVSPIAMWTDADIWSYIKYYELPYSSLYDITYEDKDGNTRFIKRNGCMFCGTDLMFNDNHLAILRQTHSRAYDVCMEKFGYRKALNILFRRYKKPSIHAAMNKQGKIARMLFSVGDLPEIRRVIPCAYDEIGEMMDLDGTGMDNEYDDELENLDDEEKIDWENMQMQFDFSN
jgi:3'-phosphoadenosine 5'-phosphosulfate sulfotransferase (PAPS reductase)/FAD synthetase